MRLARRLVQALTGLLILLALAAVGLVIALREPAVQTEVRARLAAALAEATGARVSIGGVGATLLGGIRARDVLLAFPAGARIGAAELSGSSVIPALLARRLELGTIHLRGMRVRLVPDAPAWGFDDLVDTGESSPWPSLRVLRVVVADGRLAMALGDAATPRRLVLDDVALDAGLTMDADRIRVTVGSLSGVPRGIALTPLQARGVVTVASDGSALALDELDVATRRSRLSGGARIAFDRRLDVALDLAPLSARELRAIVPAAGLRTDVSGSLVARGPWRRIGVRTALTTPASGSARAFGLLDAGGAGLPYRARARVRALDLAAIDGTLPASRLTGHLRARGGAVTTLDPPLAFHLRLEPSAVAGQRLVAARMSGQLGADGVTARGGVVVAAGTRHGRRAAVVDRPAAVRGTPARPDRRSRRARTGRTRPRPRHRHGGGARIRSHRARALGPCLARPCPRRGSRAGRWKRRPRAAWRRADARHRHGRRRGTARRRRGYH